MSERIEMINAFYDAYCEDTRLERTLQGRLEYLTTMHYIHQLIPKNSSILEIGAGTGRYSIALAKEGYCVTAIELSHNNLALLQKHAQDIDNLTFLWGDAIDLSRFDDNCFDATLILGPMYHLYERENQLQALREAIRVTKPNGIIITAFLSIYAIMQNNYLQNNFRKGFEMNFADDLSVRHFTEQVFTGFYIEEFEKLFQGLPVEYITTAAVDSILELAAMTNEFGISNEDFELFAKYHLHNCEKREYLGSSSHLLHICKKTKNKVV